jgi:uncharacterized protein
MKDQFIRSSCPNSRETGSSELSKTMYIPGYSLGNRDFTLYPLHVYRWPKRNVLLGQMHGTLLLCDDVLLGQIINRRPSADFQIKLAQRGLASLAGFGLASSRLACPRPQFFLVDMTRTCNLRCTYCYRHLQSRHAIELPTLDQITDCIAGYCRQYRVLHPCIQPWGGEPLLVLSRIERLFERLSARQISVKLTLETNGTLITPSVARRLRRMNAGVGISIDGPPCVHDAQRKSRAGRGSFDRARRGLKILWESGYDRDSVCVMATFTRHTLANIDRLPSFLSQELGVSLFKLNPVCDSNMLVEKSICVSPEEFAQAQVQLLGFLVDAVKSGSPLFEFNIRTKLRNLMFRDAGDICHSSGCQGGLRMVAFDEKGKIYPCDVIDCPDLAIGSISDRDLTEVIARAQSLHPFFQRSCHPRCITCPWRAFCNGGCPSSVWYRKGTVSDIDDYECASSRAIYPVLLDLIACDQPTAEQLAGDPPTTDGS